MTVLSVPVTYASMKNKDIDVFLGNWEPSMENDRKPYVEDKSVVVVGANLPSGAKYTLAVPQYTYDKGLKNFADIAKFKDSLKGKIYGIEPGNDGNRLVLDMIKDDKFGLKDFQLVESREQGMLAQVQRATSRNEDVVFLGWAPHPMNVNFKIQYLTGGDDSFGPNFGGAVVYTNERAGLRPSNARTPPSSIRQLKFTVDIENVVMNKILTDGEEGAEGRGRMAEDQSGASSTPGSPASRPSTASPACPRSRRASVSDRRARSGARFRAAARFGRRRREGAVVEGWITGLQVAARLGGQARSSPGCRTHASWFFDLVTDGRSTSWSTA